MVWKGQNCSVMWLDFFEGSAEGLASSCPFPARALRCKERPPAALLQPGQTSDPSSPIPSQPGSWRTMLGREGRVKPQSAFSQCSGPGAFGPSFRPLLSFIGRVEMDGVLPLSLTRSPRSQRTRAPS